MLRRAPFRILGSCRRYTSRTVQENLILDLRKTQPAFAVRASNVSILHQPPEFFKLLLDMIQRAERRIFISSLYIGSAKTELIDALSDALKRHSALQLHLVLDLNRSTRPEPSSTAQILLPLLRAHPDRVHVSLFRSPNLRGVLAKLVPPRYNEGWGTWHAKVYGVDDEVMISGANLNRSYFTNRQDRYVHFNNQCPGLAQYCFDFLKAVSTVSYMLRPSASDISTKNGHTYTTSGGYTVHWPHPGLHPHKFHAQFREAMGHLGQMYRAQGLISPEKDQVLVFPIIQAGQFGIREEESALSSLFDTISEGGMVDLTSGYFGLYKPYQNLVLAAKNVNCRIVVASPKANGFYGSSGISGRIPDGYTLFEQRFMKAVARNGREMDIQLGEWAKDDWTYHAKGLWLSENSSAPPILTLFGSTNLNSRSAHIDTELSFFMVAPPKGSENNLVMDLRARLATEVENIRANARPWTGRDRKVPFCTKVIVGLVGNML